MFNERPQTQEIILTKLDTSRKLERPLKKGDSVSLRIGDERINVKIDTVSGSSFKGTITEFHPSRGLTFQQLKLHDEIEFETKHIFSASLA